MSDLELDLRVGRTQGRELRVEVLDSPAGEVTVTATFPYDDLALESRLKDLQLALLSRSATRRRIVPEHEQAVQHLGGELFDAIFTGEVRSLLDRSREMAAASGVALRVQLRFESGDLAALPWEFLFDPRNHEYLALSRSTPVVRYVEVPQALRPLAVVRPLRLLAMVASPSDLPALDVAQERARIETAVERLRGRVELHWLEGSTWRDLQSALQREQWHAFHFVGHGGFDAASGEGILALCDDAGGTHRLGATELGILLGDHDSLRLAVLNSCDGARADKRDIFSSTASVLVRRGTPAVVAMQYEITDAAAVELSRSFYSALAEGLPVDAALTEARKCVALALPGTVEWGTPVLHLRAPDGRIFDLGSEPAGERPVTVVAEPPRGLRPRVPGWAKIAAAAVVVLAVLGGLVALGSGGDDESTTGIGTFTLDVPAGAVAVHEVSLPADSVALVRVGSDEVDADLSVMTNRAGARRLAEYLGTGFDPADLDGVLDEYRRVPAGRLVARVDEAAAGEGERLAVLAPFGGTYQVLVGGADATSGEVEVVVRLLDVEAPDEGDDLVDRVIDDTRVQTFLSAPALRELGQQGVVYLVPFLPDPGSDRLGTADTGNLFDDDAFADLPPDALECLTSRISEAFPGMLADEGGQPSEGQLETIVAQCAAQVGASGEVAGLDAMGTVVAAQLEADGWKAAGVPVSCPAESAFVEWTVWTCRSGEGLVAWVAVLGNGRWAYDYGPGRVETVADIAAPGALCRDLQEAGWPYFYSVVYWIAEGRPERLDADGNGIPCETPYPAADVGAVWG